MAADEQPGVTVASDLVLSGRIRTAAGKPVREGDQQLPTVNDRPDVQSQVIADMLTRREVGIGRYGTALQPFNGRDAAQDAYEEALDLLMYWKQWLIERRELLAEREALLDRVAELEAEVERLRP
jgi:hypothetical protein